MIDRCIILHVQFVYSLNFIYSIAGHIVPQNLAKSLGMYPPSKFAITAMTQVLREELRAVNSRIKVTVRRN